MAEKIQQSTSRLREEGVHQGCLWGLFQSFNVHQSLRLRRILGERKSAIKRISGMKVRKMKMKMNAPPASNEVDLVEANSNTLPQVEDITHTADKGFDEVHSRARTGKEMPKRQDIKRQKDQKQRVNRRLLRSMSIHHMECNDYILPSKAPNDSQFLEASVLPHNSDSSKRSENVLPFPEPAIEVHKGKQCNACGMINEHTSSMDCKEPNFHGYQLPEKQAPLQGNLKDSIISLLGAGKNPEDDIAPKNPNDILKALEILAANKELFLKLLQEPDRTISDYLQGQDNSRSELALAKSSSFPGVGLSASFKTQSDVVASSEQDSEAKNLHSLETTSSTRLDSSELSENTLSPSPFPKATHEIAFSVENLSSFPYATKNHIGNGKGAYHFKIIKQRIKDIIKDNREERQRISMDRVLHKIPYGSKAFKDANGRESFPQELLNSKACETGNSRHSFASEAAGSLGFTQITHGKSIGIIQRSRSLNESLERYSALLGSSSSRETKKQIPEGLKPMHNVGSSQSTTRTFQRIFSLPQVESFSLSKDYQIEVSRNFLPRPISLDPAHGNEVVVLKEAGEQSLSKRHQILGDEGPSLLEYARHGQFNNLEVSSSSDEQTSSSCDEHHTPEENSIFPFSSSCLEDPIICTEFFAAVTGSEGETDEICSEMQDPSGYLVKQCDVDGSSFIETDDVQTQDMLLGFNAFRAPRDEHVLEFHCVKNMLNAYISNGNQFLGRCSSPSKLIKSEICDEVDGSTSELEPENGFSGIDHELIYDLTNQVLLEIYERSYDHCPWLLHVGSYARPTPVGYHLLEEVWANISWHLKSHLHGNPTLEYVDRDLKRNDGWMKLTYDVEYIGLDLEAMFLDDLLDEIIVCFIHS